MLEWTIDYCKERKAFGKPLTKFQNTQFKIVEMATEIKLGRTFLDKLIVEHMNGDNVVVEVSMAKAWTTEMCKNVADRCVQLHGGYGYCEEYKIARAWRDSRVLSIFAGTNEIMKTVNPLFPALRSGPAAASGASPKKQTPSNPVLREGRATRRQRNQHE